MGLQAKQNAQAEGAATQASKQAGVARAVPQAAPKKAAVSKGAAPAAGAAVAVPKRPRTKPQPAPAASAAAAAARKPAPVAIDDDEIPLAVRIAAGRKAQQQRPQKPAPMCAPALSCPYELIFHAKASFSCCEQKSCWPSLHVHIGVISHRVSSWRTTAPCSRGKQRIPELPEFRPSCPTGIYLLCSN